MDEQVKQKKKCNYKPGEQGQIMPLALVVFLVLILIEAVLITDSYLEKRMSLNDAITKQARQAAIAGLEWAMADLRHNLVLYDDNISLLWYHNKKVQISAADEIYFILNHENITDNPEEQYCLFTINCNGNSRKAQCHTQAAIRFDYDIIDDSAGSGKIYQEGQIVYFELVVSS